MSTRCKPTVFNRLLSSALMLFLALSLATPASAANDKDKNKEKKPKKKDEASLVIVQATGEEKPPPGHACPAVVKYVDSGGQGCVLDLPGEVVDILSVHATAAHPVSIRIPEPVDIEVTYTVTTLTPELLMLSKDANDGNFVHTITVTAPANALRTHHFYIHGQAVGQAELELQRHPEPGPEPDTVTHYTPFNSPVAVWQFEGMFDYNDLGAGDLCYDPLNSPALAPDLQTKISCGETPKAVAADGVSRQLLKLRAGTNGQACFKLIDDGLSARNTSTLSHYFGSLHNPADDGSAVAVPTEPTASMMEHWAFGTYLPPSDFFTSDRVREVTIEIAYTPENPSGGYDRTATTRRCETITIHRPPVLLVHGLGPNFWGNPYQVRKDPPESWIIDWEFAYDSRLPLTAAYYVNKLKSRIGALIDKLREKRIAATQVDLIAHSMGGLVARRFLTQDESQLFLSENFNKGDVRKLVALASPLKGTQFANGIINLHENFVANGNHDSKIILIESLFLGDNVHYGSVCSLAENSSILPMDSTKGARVMAFSASGGLVNELEFSLSFLLSDFSSDDRLNHIAPYIFADSNDGLVSEESQRGDLSPAHVRNFQHGTNGRRMLHMPFLNLTSANVLRDEVIAEAIFVQLDLETDWATALPAISSNGSGIPINGGRGVNQVGTPIDGINYVSQCTPGQPMHLYTSYP